MVTATADNWVEMIEGDVAQTVRDEDAFWIPTCHVCGEESDELDDGRCPACIDMGLGE